MDFVPPERWSPDLITLITGPSGAGKSVLAQLWSEAIPDAIEPVMPDEMATMPLIDMAGPTPEVAIQRLTAVGLGDPITWCKSPNLLSDGQIERLKLAAVLSEQGFPVIDEWLARLDRPTAKCVAFTTGKRLAELGRGGLFITSHDDLAEYLRPHCVVRVGWEPEPEVLWPGWDDCENPILRGVELRPGTKQDWKALAPLHYAAGDPATFAEVYRAGFSGDEIPAAVIVLSYPDLHSYARNLATSDRFAIRGKTENARRLNQDLRRMSRIVVAPQYRSCGLARHLIEYAAGMTSARFIECTTAMGKYSRFLEKASFREYPNVMNPAELALAEFAETRSIPPHAGLDAGTLDRWTESLSVRDQRTWRRLVYRVYHQLVLHRRTRKPVPKRVPGPSEIDWLAAHELALRRITDRPTYWLRETRPSGVREPSESHSNGTAAAQSH